ncbi:di-heme-cytochrome C peroxidase [Nitrobacter sp. NHB1]|uniref:di-heme-cytochrome C peroxidase n=1 Tax=Nitrobacter sp. NHB1 TaxID=3119830 RepID=UPI00300003B5
MRTLILAFVLLNFSVVAPSLADESGPVFVDQGPAWDASSRTDFYTRDQGSQLIPFAWLEALKRADGTPFLSDGLARYGYLPGPEGSIGLPLGFHATGPTGAKVVGMTCSACHTRQIKVGDRQYRIDGGPALVDFQAFLGDLDKAVARATSDDAAFQAFAASVLQTAKPNSDKVAALRSDVDAWYVRYHTIIDRSLPNPGWGLGRLDAVGMIFNRVTGLGIGPEPSFLIPENIHRADAPVRYPFLWNAPKQDKTQWPGFADNGSDILGLARNVGEVMGVFGNYQPTRDGLFIDFLNNNSANFDGLQKLEELTKKIGPPKWPWSVDTALAAKGKAIFERPTASGGCQECHGEKAGKVRFPFQKTWATPIQNVGTDTREYDILGWTAKSGVLKGAYIPFATKPLKETDLAFNILSTSVIGTIGEHVVSFATSSSHRTFGKAIEPGAAASTSEPVDANRLPSVLQDLPGAFRFPNAAATLETRHRLDMNAESPTPPKGAYESRVLHGIWAAAPYLHNGSVASLAELLKPASQRQQRFAIGPDYDLDNVGIASNQAQSDHVRETTGCDDLNSGNSRCGHEFGTSLPDADKKALLEYLKTL